MELENNLDLFDAFDFDIDMLYGRFNHSLDSKGRVIIPARFRKCLGEIVVLTRGSELDCLNVYSIEEWKKKMIKFRSIPMNDAAGQKFIRYFLGNAVPCQLDKQGKVLIPPHLREAAHLEKEVTLTGMVDRVEIWSAENWNKCCDYENSDELRTSIQSYDF